MRRIGQFLSLLLLLTAGVLWVAGPSSAAKGYDVKIKADGRMKKLQEKWFGTSFETPDTAPEPSF